MKEKHEDTNMKKKTLHPIMIALLALFVLLQAFCLTAFGAETVEVYIPAGTETETVNQILTETLLSRTAKIYWNGSTSVLERKTVVC